MGALKRAVRDFDAAFLGGRLRHAYHYGLGPRRPKMLSVEPTSRCNLNCPFCLVGLQNSLPSTEHDLLPRGMGTMEMDLYRKIVGDAADFGIEKMQLHFQGEPLLHKGLPEMVRLATAAGMSTQMFTNGLPLTETTADKLLDAGLGMLRFSVDGVTEEVYQKNRVGGEFARVYRNMKMMAGKARARRSPIRLEWQMIAMRNNEHEIERAAGMAREIGLNFFVKSFAVTDPKAVPLDPKYQRRLHIKPCQDIYRAIFVYWNGDVVPCCYDQEGKAIVGNLGRQTLREVWDSPIYAALRRRIDRAYRRPEEEPELCKTCLKWGHEPWKTSDGKTIWGAEGARGEIPPDDDLV
ncbi:MAG: radical SAM protein [Candidatus Rokubacteria bacterium]|nr:radical SAM protein [Candidatus Rokubacteria bacterium]